MRENSGGKIGAGIECAMQNVDNFVCKARVLEVWRKHMCDYKGNKAPPSKSLHLRNDAFVVKSGFFLPLLHQLIIQ